MKKTKKSVATVKTNNAHVNKFILQKKQFGTSDDVQTFLDERGFEDFEISDSGDSFIAASKTVIKSSEDLKTIPYPEFKDTVQIEVMKHVEIEVTDDEPAAKEDSKDEAKKDEDETPGEDGKEPDDGEGEGNDSPEDAEDGGEGNEPEPGTDEDPENEDTDGDGDNEESGTEDLEVDKSKKVKDKSSGKYNKKSADEGKDTAKKYLKDGEIAKKFDWYAAVTSGSKSFKEALDAGYDGLASGSWDLVDVLVNTMKNAFIEDDLVALDGSLTEFKQVMVNIHNATKGLDGVAKATVAKSLFNKELIEGDEVQAKKTQDNKESKVKKSALDTSNIDDLKLVITEVAKSLISKHLEPITERLEETSKALKAYDSTTKKSADTVEKLQEELTAAKKMVSKLSKVRPTMKSADQFENDYEDEDEETPESLAKKSELKKFANAFVV